MRLCAFLFVVMGLALSPSMTPGQEAVVVSYDIDASFTSHEPIVATFVAENRLQEAATLDLGADRTKHFELTVKQGPVRVPQQTSSGTGGMTRLGRVELQPGARYVQRLLLDDWFALEQTGTYEIEIRLASPIRTQAGTIVSSSTGGTLRFQILPRNEAVLRERCARLTADLLTAPDVENQIRAARELSSVRDPVALQYVGQALERTDKYDSILLKGLTRIGSTDAKALLQRLAQSAEPERAALVHSALSHMR
jgi:hypothetical protein